LSQAITSNRFIIFPFILPLLVGREGQVWEPSSKMMFFPPPPIKLLFDKPSDSDLAGKVDENEPDDL
jgi:hypothetical protein